MTENRRAIKRAVVINDLTARANPLRLGQLPAYAWRPGYVHKYASLWVTALRFFILNRPDFPSFVADVCKNRHTFELQKYIYIDAPPGFVGKCINVDFFVESLRENRDSFRWANLSDFPLGFQLNMFSERPAICLTCISHGFHSAIYSLKWFDKCPLHEERLIYVCPICGKSLKSAMRVKQKFAASICNCNNQWMSMEMARCPPENSDRDNLLSDIVKWIEDAASKCWIYIPYSREYDNSVVGYRHLSLGLSEFNESMPAWIDMKVPSDAQFTAPRYRPFPIGSILDLSSVVIKVRDRIKRVFDSGFVFGNISRLEIKSCSVEIDFEDLVKYKISSFFIFKSMLRYAIKHLLGKRVHLIHWVERNQSARKLRNKVEVNKYAATAWAILHWMRASIWRTIVADRWFKGFLDKEDSEYYFLGGYYRRTYGAQRVILAGAQEKSELWIENRVNAASLLDLFPTHEDLQRCCTDQGFIEESHGPLPRTPLEWWAWRGVDNRLRLAVMQRQPVFWNCVASRAPSKTVRTAEAEKKHVSRQLDLHEQIVAPGIEFGSDASWQYRGDLADLAHGTVRCSRLVMGNKNYYRFCVAELPRNLAAQGERWVLRCLDLPLLVFSSTTQEGVYRLKQAAKLYQKSCLRS